MIDINTIKELISYSNILCESIIDMPSGCEGCWLFEYDEEFKCPLKNTINQIKEQIDENK